MARARNIKPKFFQNDQLGELDPLARLLFIGMWTIADFRGVIEYRPKRLKAQVLPYDDCDIQTLVKTLDKSGFISIYSVQSQPYIKVLKFEAHQAPHKNEREGGSDLPDIDKKDNEISELTQDGFNPDKDGTTRAESLFLNPSLLNPESLVETASPPAPRKASIITLASYLANCKQEAIKPISENDPVFTYADSIGLSREFLLLAWDQFKDRYMENGKRQKDWPMTFRNAVKGNWFKLWFLSNDGGYALTTVGQQAKRANEVAA